MTEWTHSIVLFSGEDGLPLEFNVRNTSEKSLLKALIEHGGGICTQSENAVHLISPGTNVLNADLGKKLVSSRYIFDCVEQNYLLDVNGYVFTIAEEPTSDISDEDSGRRLIGNESNGISIEKQVNFISNGNVEFSTTGVKDSRMDSSLSTPSKLSGIIQKSLTSSNQSESFVEASQDTSKNPRIAGGMVLQHYDCIPLTSTAKEPDSMEIPDNYEDIEKDLSPIQASESLVNPGIRNIVPSQNLEKTSPKKVRFSEKILSPSRAATVSQPKKTLFETGKRMRDLSPIQACTSLTSPKKITNVPSPQSSPKQLRKNVTSPNRVPAIVHLKETLLGTSKKTGINDYFTLKSSNKTGKNHNVDSNDVEMSSDPSEEVAFVVSPQKRTSTFPRYEQADDSVEVVSNQLPVAASPVHAAVSSSQQEFDQFDNMLISKAQKKVPSDDEESLSQSYTVSSSADAQKPNSAEVFAAGPSSQLPDSPTLDQVLQHNEGDLDELSLYIRNLEAEVEKILLKPSPKSIHDKICLVKYVCCVKKLPPKDVFQSLLQL